MYRNKDNEKKRMRLTAVDWLLILLTLLLVFFGARYLYRRYRTASPDTVVTYRVCVRGVDTSVFHVDTLIPTGASVTSANGTAQLGKVLSTEVLTSKAPQVQKGELVLVEHPYLRDLLITVRASAIDRLGDGLRVNDIRVAAGEVWELRLGSYYATAAEVVEVKREAES